MALKGTLKDFSVADIFQLIGQQTKSGSLYVRTEEHEARIVFDKGKVVLGTFKKSYPHLLLGTMFQKSGVITQAQLSEAIENQKVTLRSLGDILRSMGAITSEILGEFVSLQLTEVLFLLFQWKDGFYEFIAEEIKYNRSIIKPKAAEAVLMDGYRMLDEWPGVIKKIGSLDNVFRSLVDPGEIVASAEQEMAKGGDDIDMVFEEFEEPKDVKTEKEHVANFTPIQKNVLRLLDGARPLQDIAYRSRLGTFEAAKIVAELLDQGRVVKIDSPLDTVHAKSLKERDTSTLLGWLQSGYKPLIASALISAALPFLAFGIKSHWSNRYNQLQPATVNYDMTPLTFQDLKIQNERSRLENLLELYSLENETYPLGLDALGEKKLSKRWTYEFRDDSYLLQFAKAF